jgi:hypothetical protein
VIVETFGCNLQFFPSHIAVVISVVPMLMLMVGSVIYGCTHAVPPILLLFQFSCYGRLLGVALFHLVRHRRTNAAILGLHLKSRHSSLSSTQYYRLMATSMILGLWGTGWILFLLVIDITKGGNYPLPSWKAIHSNDSHVYTDPTARLTREDISIHSALWWAFPSAAYVYFLLFATNREVLSDYQNFWVWFRTRVLGQIVQTNSTLTIRTEYVLS